MRFVVGIDETGTERQLSDGWCFYGLPDFAEDAFNLVVDKVKATHGQQTFHGKEFNLKQSQQYQDFLTVIRDFAVQQPISIASSYLYRKDWHKNLSEFGTRVFAKSTDIRRH